MSDNHKVDIEEGQEVVGRTIVGGRPMVRRNRKMKVPIGVERVLCRAAMDPAFKEALLKDRAQALKDYAMGLSQAEELILKSAPASALAAMIDQIDLELHGRRRFMKAVAACVLAAAAGSVAVSCGPEEEVDGGVVTRGIDPDVEDASIMAGISPEPDASVDVYEAPPPTGITPDEPDSGD